MRFIVEALQVEDYRNIRSQETLRLKDITAIVGANESGKTSLLEALGQLSTYTLSIKDTTNVTQRADRGELPELTFFLKPDEELVKELQQHISNFTEHSLITLTINSDAKKNWSLGLATYNRMIHRYQRRQIRFIKVFKNTTGEELEISLPSGIVRLPPGEETRLHGRSPQNAQLVRRGSLSAIPPEEVGKRLMDEVIGHLPSIRWWPPREFDGQGIGKIYDRFYIKDSVRWNDFIAAPAQYPSVKSLFDTGQLANKSLADWISVLQGYQKRDDDRAIATYLGKLSKGISRAIMERWNQSEISVDCDLGRGSMLVISIYENGKRIEPSTRSEGFKWFLSFLLHFFADEESPEESLILMDQPGGYLHPGAQKEFRRRFEDIVAAGNQVVYATQSPFLIDRNEWSRTQFLKKTDKGTVIKTPSNVDVANDSLLRESLGYTLVDIGQANELNVVVEGYTDRWLLQTITRVIKNREVRRIGKTDISFDLNKLSIVDAEGIFGRENLFSKVESLRNVGLKAIGIYDGDKQGKGAIEAARKDPNLGSHFYLLSSLVPRQKIESGEDLVPESIYHDALKKLKSVSLTKSELKTLTTRPRVTKLTGKFGANNVKGVKNELWDIISKEILSGLDKDQPPFLKDKEVEWILRVVNKSYKALAEEEAN